MNVLSQVQKSREKENNVCKAKVDKPKGQRANCSFVWILSLWGKYVGSCIESKRTLKVSKHLYGLLKAKI